MLDHPNSLAQKLCLQQQSLEQAQPKKYEAIVVGAGPAGIAAVGNLVERKMSPILWIDNEFEAGRLNKYYREVPSNTKVKLFIAFADALSTFQRIVKESQFPNAYSQLQDLQPDKTCELEKAADLCLMLTRGLDQSMGVYKKLGTVCSASWSDHSKWNITLEDSLAVETDASEMSSNILILCNGSRPKTIPLPLSHLQDVGLDLALKPSILSTYFPRNPKIVVAVIGGSHSAILVLRNLYNLAVSSHPSLRIKWFTRHPLRFAEERDGWILYDNTGLKGEVAIWARKNILDEELEKSNVGRYLEKVTIQSGEEENIYEKHLPSCTHVVQAIGLSPNDVPVLIINGLRPDLKFNHESQVFEDSGVQIKGLYGAGIAWPERVTDPEGNLSLDVGIWKFMRSAKKAAIKWQEA